MIWMWDAVHGGLEPQSWHYIKVLKLFIYIYYGCGMQSTRVWSLNYGITTSLGLAHIPFFKIGPHPDCSGWETSQEGDCVLLPKKWNKDNKGAWRMDLPVDNEDTYDDGCEDEIDKNDYQVDTGNRESESSMSISSN